jgi:hypothetical protein
MKNLPCISLRNCHYCKKPCDCSLQFLNLPPPKGGKLVLTPIFAYACYGCAILNLLDVANDRVISTSPPLPPSAGLLKKKK